MSEPDRNLDLSALLARHLPRLRAYVRLRAGHAVRAHESCSDLVQSVCVELLGNAERMQFSGDGQFRMWLYRAAERKIVDRARRWQSAKRRAATLPADGALLEEYATLCTPSRDAIAEEEVARIERAFDALEPADRDVIVAARLVGLSHAEIAADAGTTAGAVRTRLCRALARLSDLLANR